ncbi:HXXEE domain-containing protein [Desulfitobacterium sp. Sab5]|uniref:HXXEE domain-containing protein n=1 Tax=Desulfitobacterium nosdiversum TaxID=3375356 RepID=UPI003CF6BBA7
MNLLNFDIQYFMIGIIITYIPFHLLEEALGDFPTWMKEHKWIPEKVTYGHWMANNLFFYLPLLLIGLISFHFGGDKLLFLGVGIIVWGFINCFDHIIYTIKDRRISPGLFTGLIFGVISVLGLYKIYIDSMLTIGLLALSIIIGLIYAFLPIGFSVIFHKIFNKIFV